MQCHQQSKTNLIVPDDPKGVVLLQTKKFAWSLRGVEKVYFEIAKKKKKKNFKKI